jgi:hypothetical protein
MTIDDMSIQVRSKISFKDVPLFQIKGLYVYDKNQRIFDTVGDFLNTFEKILNAENVNLNQDWCKWLNCSINQEHQAWFDQNLLSKNLLWKEAKSIFEARFESMVYKLFMGVKAVTMEMNKGESVIAFGERLLKAMHEGEVDDCQALAYRFLGCLPGDIANAVSAAWAGQQHGGNVLPSRVHQLVDIARTITLPMDVKYKQKEITLANNKSVSSRPCRYCKKPWIPGHRCLEHTLSTTGKVKVLKNGTARSKWAHKSKKIKTDKMAVDSEAAKGKNIIKVNNIKKMLTSVDSQALYLPIIIQDIKLFALLDTGTDVSVLSLKICIKNNHHRKFNSDKSEY